MATKVFFKIYGRDLVKLARDRFDEGPWEPGFRLLAESLPELPVKEAIAILEGKRSLRGCNDLRLVDEKPATSQKRQVKLRRRWAGIVLIQGRAEIEAYRPYAIVTSFDRRDLAGAGRWKWNRPLPGMDASLSELIRALDEFASRRASYYMDDPDHDFPSCTAIYKREIVENPDLRMHGGGYTVLWGRVPTLPYWRHAPLMNRSLQSAFIEYVELIGLPPARGASLLVDTSLDDGYEEEKLPPEAHKPPEALVERKELNPLKELVPGLVEYEARQLQQEKIAETPPQEDVELASPWGWMMRDGKFYACERVGHRALAQALLRFRWEHKATESQLDNAEKAADELGWIKIGSMMDGKPVAFHDKPLTQQQKDRFTEWCHRHETKPAQVIFNWNEDQDG